MPRGFDEINSIKDLIRNEKYIKAMAALKKAKKLGQNIRKMAALKRARDAELQFVNQRKKGMNLNRLIDACQPNIRFNAIRDKVTIVALKRTDENTRILSRSLTYDRTKGVLQVRPHKHEVRIVPSSGERYDVSFSKAKRLKFYCDCEYWLFDCEYAMARKYGATDIRYSNGAFPIIKNPGLYPNMCKHGYVLLNYIKQRNL